MLLLPPPIDCCYLKIKNVLSLSLLACAVPMLIQQDDAVVVAAG